MEKRGFKKELVILFLLLTLFPTTLVTASMPEIVSLKAEYIDNNKEQIRFSLETDQATIIDSRLCYTGLDINLASYCIYPKTSEFKTENELIISSNEFRPAYWTGPPFNFSKDMLQLAIEKIENQAGESAINPGMIIAIPFFKVEKFKIESNKYLRIIFRHGFNLSQVNNTNNFQIYSQQDSNYNPGKNPLKIGFEWVAINSIAADRYSSTRNAVQVFDYEVILELPNEMKEGNSYTLNIPFDKNNQNLTFENKTISFTYTDNELNDNIHVNQIGYFTDKEKYAYLGAYGGDLGPLEINPSSFLLINKNTGQSVFSGTPKRFLENNPSRIPFIEEVTGENLYELNFSSFSTPGNYYILVPRVGKSYEFKIDNNVWDSVLKDLLRAFYHQRSGFALEMPFTNFTRPASHIGLDGYFANLSTVSINDTINWPLYNQEIPGAYKETEGGWFDAGDNIKYVITATATLSDLMNAYEFFPDKFYDGQMNIPESENGIPDILDEIKWELDWLLKMQDTNDGFVYMKVGETDRTKSLTAPRYILPKTTHLTANYAAIMAQASRIAKAFDPSLASTYLQRAELAWQALEGTNKWLEENHTIILGGFDSSTPGIYDLKYMPVEVEGIWLKSDTLRTGANYWTNQIYGAYIRGLELGDQGSDDGEIMFSKTEESLAGTEITIRYLGAVPIPSVKFTEPCCGGPYDDDGDYDNRLWAAAELYKTTGKQEYYDRFNLLKGPVFACKGGRASERQSHHYDEAVFAYATTPNWPNINQTDRDSCKFAGKNTADYITNQSSQNAYRQSSPASTLSGFGGISDSHARAFQLIRNYILIGDEKYYDAALNNLNFQLGANGLSMVFITATGYKSPTLISHGWATQYRDTLGLIPGFPIYGVTHWSSYGAKDFYKSRYPRLNENGDYIYPIHKSYININSVDTNEPVIDDMSQAVFAYAAFASDSTSNINSIAPQNFNITLLAKSELLFEWEALAEATGYNLLWGPSPGNYTGIPEYPSGFSNLGNTSSSKSFINQSVKAYIAIEAYDENNTNSLRSNEIFLDYISSPANFKELILTNNHRAFSWNPVQGATGYELRWGQSKGIYNGVNTYPSGYMDMGNSLGFNIIYNTSFETYAVVNAYKEVLNNRIRSGFSNEIHVIVNLTEESEFEISNSGGNNWFQDTDMNSNQEALVSWIDAGDNIKFARYKTDKTLFMLAKVNQNKFSGGINLDPYWLRTNTGAALHDDGSFAVAWKMRNENNGDNMDIFLRLFNTEGNPITNDIRGNSKNNDHETELALTTGANNSYILTFTRLKLNNSNLSDIYFRIFNSSGKAITGEIKANKFTHESQDMPDIASDSNGNFVIVWRSMWQDGSMGEIYGNIFLANGTPLFKEETRINDWTFNAQRHPSVDINNNGNIIVAWSSGYSGFNQLGFGRSEGARDRHEWGIAAKLFNKTGNPISDELKVNNKKEDSQELPSVAIDDSGRFIVAWKSDWQDPLKLTNNKKLHIRPSYRLYDENANPLSPELHIDENFYDRYGNLYNQKSEPKIAIDSQGNFLVTYLDKSSGASQLYGKYFNKSEFTAYNKPAMALISPTSISGKKDDIISYDLIVENIQNLHEATFSLEYNNPDNGFFNNDLLKAINIREGHLNLSGATNFIIPSIDKIGYIGKNRDGVGNDGRISLENPQTAINGSGVLATIEFIVNKNITFPGLKANETGYARIKIKNIELKDPSGKLISFESIKYNGSSSISITDQMFSDGIFSLNSLSQALCVENVSIDNKPYMACRCGDFTIYNGYCCDNTKKENACT